ncbi:glutathione peroxidase [Massilia sp. Leaf139]|uniref:glutathione peroxidase n=1 Tax=Massilia sp. Leaf139 TaxID=1736272 RepID=UPI0006F20C35|nr:glutathione peroxidase [Massilia sp. Leaf139]KQQ91872.1 glutathione peroxidase [Massilia sp. Leaf139]
MNVFDFSATALDGAPIDLSRYRGKVLLIVNTASACGFTPQYKGLEAVYGQFRERGVEVLGFPCNQFGQQESGSEAEIGAFCEKNYGVSFPLFAKIEVNGESAHPLFQHLKREAPGLLGTQRIKWNFTKFLVGRDGQVVKRYAPQTKPEAIASDIEALLAQ